MPEQRQATSDRDLRLRIYQRRLPPGASRSGAVWSAYVLPYVEETALYDSLTLFDLKENDSDHLGTRHWYLDNGQSERVGCSDLCGPIVRNMSAIKQHVSVFLCPSASSVQLVLWRSIDDAGPQAKLQPSYVPCGSHRLMTDSDPQLVHALHDMLSGAFTYGESLTVESFGDGLSKTIFIGETMSGVRSHVTASVCRRTEHNNDCVPCRKLCAGPSPDRAFIGSDDLDHGTDLSEFFCSTAVPMDWRPRREDLCKDCTGKALAADELMFGSNHRGVTIVVFGDGSAKPVRLKIDQHVFESMGSRNGRDR